MILAQWRQYERSRQHERLVPWLLIVAGVTTALLLLWPMTPPSPPDDRPRPVALVPLDAAQWARNKATTPAGPLPRARSAAPMMAANDPVPPPEEERKAPEKEVIPPPPPPPKPPENEKPAGQVVDIARPEVEERPEKADFSSPYDSKVDKQSLARDRRPTDNPAPRASDKGLPLPKSEVDQREDHLALSDTPPTPSPEAPRSEQAREAVPERKEERPAPGGEPEPQENMEIPDERRSYKLKLKEEPDPAPIPNREDHPRESKGNGKRLVLKLKLDEQGREGTEGSGVAQREAQPGQETRQAVEGETDGTSGGARNNIPKNLLPDFKTAREVSGAPANDYVDSVDEGDETWLNSKSYKYATFFNRLKRKVSQHWRPVEAQLRYDPHFTMYGYQSRYTVLEIVLDGQGRLIETSVAKTCGVDFLDEEAVQAIRRAAPFPNPPTGLVENGEIRFQFGFFFEINRFGAPVGRP